MISKQPDIEVFWDWNQDSMLWDAAGFASGKRPQRSIAFERLNELYDYLPGFLEGRQKLWRLAMHCDERVGRHIHIDATATDAHARLHHECADPKWCAANGGKKMPVLIERLDVGNANTKRQKENALAPEEAVADAVPADRPVPEPDEDDGVDVEELVLDELEQEEGQHPKYARRPSRRRLPDGKTEVFIANSKGGPKHRYVCRDGDAGFRIYTDAKGKKMKGWFGYLKLRAVDDYTGAEIASLHLPADELEYKHFRALIERVHEVLGLYPEAVVVDRGHNVSEVRRACLELGVGFVGPFRKPNGAIKKRSQLRVDGVIDEYGFCYCKHCGSPGTDHRFEPREGTPYISYVCANTHDAKCRRGRQFFDGSKAPMLANVLHKEDELYWELRKAGKPQERAHRSARARYTTGANNIDTRPKRIGVEFLEMRSAISHFVEIFRVCIRQGWLGDHSHARPFPPRKRSGGIRGLEVLRRLRRIHGLLFPRGPKALALGLIWDGIIPEGWIPIKERRRQARAGRKGEPPPPGDPATEPF